MQKLINKILLTIGLFLLVINTSYAIPIFTQVEVNQDIEARIKGKSYKEPSPVLLRDLRYLQITYIDFSGNEQHGEMIVHKEVAEDVIGIFQELYYNKFPIAKMKLIDDYNADDDASMKANNTSSLNIRQVKNSTSWSKHSFGLAIDINPVQNPYVLGRDVEPIAGRAYVNREGSRPGMATNDSIVVKAFKLKGWTWGGDWQSPKDYQHFEKKISQRKDVGEMFSGLQKFFQK